MILEGVATNVTHFGAFVDVGVHQDGLVHISAMSHQYIDDPSKVIKAGDIVKVKVMDVDVPRKRISLSMRLDDEAGADSKAGGNVEGKAGNGRGGNGRSRGSRSPKAEEPTAMAALMKEAMKKKGGRL